MKATMQFGSIARVPVHTTHKSGSRSLGGNTEPQHCWRLIKKCSHSLDVARLPCRNSSIEPPGGRQRVQMLFWKKPGSNPKNPGQLFFEEKTRVKKTRVNYK